MRDVTLRFILRETYNAGWRLVIETDGHCEKVCNLNAESEWGAVDELSELLGEALRRIAAERTEQAK